MGKDSTPANILTVLAEKSQLNQTNSETQYKRFLVTNEKEILHNIAESLKSVKEKLEQKEDFAWQEYQELNDIAPSDNEDEEVVRYRKSALTTLYVDLAVATKALTDRRQALEKLRREVCAAMNKIKKEVRRHQRNGQGR